VNVDVVTTDGAIRGVESDGVLSFKGIPYAGAPIGERRFAPPVAVTPWPGVRDCSQYGPISIQSRDATADLIPGAEWLYYAPGAVTSEDCLNLNVWTPSTDGSRAVLVWIHGGNYLTGSGAGLWLEGSNLAAGQDVVVVTVNYRLGALGFLFIDDPDGSPGYVGNNALLDHVAALRWVQANIAHFGGDPDRVCVFGESAGAMSTGLLLGMPAAKGLFGRAIMESGHVEIVQSPAAGRALTERFLVKLGIPSGPDALARLRDVDVATLLAVQDEIVSETPVPFRPVLEDHYLPDDPKVVVAAGGSLPELVIGNNRDETKLPRALMTRAAGGWSVDLPGMVASAFRSDHPAAAELTAGYRRIEPDDHEAADLFTTDRYWRLPIRKFIDAYLAGGGAVFVYEFGYRTPVLDGQLGACHALEIPFVFDNLDEAGVEGFVGADPDGAGERRTTAAAMSAAWATFARDGIPRAPGVPDWPAQSVADRPVMQIGDRWHVIEDPHRERVEHWLALGDAVSDPFGT
jgi:para-nitrobenzyl esterase